jgi:uncharacterized protein
MSNGALLDPATGLEYANPATAKYYNEIYAIWPDLYNHKVNIAPAGNGVDRRTGRYIGGWRHVEQSLEVIFATPFHERVLRRWVGSFVPQLLGESTVPRIITRFYWAIATSIDLWEPRYRIKQVFYMGSALSNWSPTTSSLEAADLIRLGQAIFRQEGVYYPRGHLGDFTPYELRAYGLISRGGQFWDVVPVGASG